MSAGGPVRRFAQALGAGRRWLVCGLYGPVALSAVFVAISTLPRLRAWRVAQRIYRFGFALMGLRVGVTGLTGIDPSRPYILVGNHTSVLDHFALCVALPTPIVGIEKRENFRLPLYGPLMRQWGNIAIDRGDPTQARAALVEASTKLRADGTWLLVFPEGTRSHTGALGPFKKGAFHIAKDTGVALLPFTLVGMREAIAGEAPPSWLGTIELVLHAPVDPAETSAAGVAALAERVRDVVGSVLDNTTRRPSHNGLSCQRSRE